MGKVHFRLLTRTVIMKKQKMKDLLLQVRVVVRTSNIKIPRRRLVDCVKNLNQKACRTWSTIFFPYSTNQSIRWWRWRCRRHFYRNIRELKQPRRQRQQKPHKFAYLTMENSIFARFARAYFIFWHFEDVLVLSTTWNDLFCSCVDDVSIWWQMFNSVFLCPKRLFQFNSRTVRIHFASITTLNN